MAVENFQTIELDLDRKALSLVPHIDQWDGLWMIEPSRLNFLTAAINSIDLESHLQRNKAWYEAPEASDYREDRDGIAIISLNGTLQKHSMSIGGATSTVLARRAIREASTDTKIKKLMLAIESPGGTAAGTPELASEVAAAAKRKPVHAHITDLGASAAYWVASQANTISANEMAVVGSIGTYQVVQDISAIAEKRGIKVHVIKAGAFKGTGVPGSEITDEQLQYMQQLIEDRNDLFVAGVAGGRHVDEQLARVWADGRAHVAKTAASMGLIDSIQSFEEAFEQLKQKQTTTFHSNPKREDRMSDTPTEPVAVTPKAIRAACPGCSNDFVVKCLDDGSSIERCRDLHMESLVNKVESLTDQLGKANQSIETLEKEKAELAKTGVGVDGLAETTSSTGDGAASPSEAYWAKVAEVQGQKNCTRSEAQQFVNRNFRDLRMAMLADN